MKDTRTGFGDDTQSNAENTLTKLFDDRLPGDPLAPYQVRVQDWTTTYLTAPHSRLCRKGTVWRFAAASMSREIFWAGCIDRPDLTADDIARTVAGAVAGFSQLLTATRPDELLKTVLILCPAITDYSLIGRALQHLNGASITTGLIIGQFHPGCEYPIPIGRKDWAKEHLKRFTSSISASAHDMSRASLDLTQP